jgi:hypothetical protein
MAVYMGNLAEAVTGEAAHSCAAFAAAMAIAPGLMPFLRVPLVWIYGVMICDDVCIPFREVFAMQLTRHLDANARWFP